jgi:hypothetical protein
MGMLIPTQRGRNVGKTWRMEIRDGKFAVVDTRYDDRDRELLVFWYHAIRPVWGHNRPKRFIDYRHAIRAARRLNAFGKAVASAGAA